METDFDILIVGGGLVGSALATALKNTSFRIGMIEARPLVANTDPDYNERSVALGFGSRRILEALGVWDHVAPNASPIDTVHVSEKGRLGVTRIKAEKHHLPALGYVALNRDLGVAFVPLLETQDNLTVIAPAVVQSFDIQDEQAKVKLLKDGQEETLSCKLLVAADGTGSFSRQQLDMPSKVEEYAQYAVIANVTPKFPHKDVAYERFTLDGPLALLPLTENRCAMVWTQTPEQWEITSKMDDEEFLQALERHFGQRLGGFERTGERQAYPLALQVTDPPASKRSLVIGNAAHTLHPISGQGLNLALRDVADLAESLWTAADPGAEYVLEDYVQRRQKDVQRTVTYTNSLLRLFMQPAWCLSHLRGAGLMMADRIPFIGGWMAKQSMGFLHSNTRLARGIPLKGEQQ